MAARRTLTPLFSALKPYEQIETADKEVPVKEEGLQYLFTTDGVILSLGGSISAPSC